MCQPKRKTQNAQPNKWTRKLARQVIGLSLPILPNRANGRALARARAAVCVCPRVRVGGWGPARA